MITVNTDEICAAPERLFIPNQTLKTPNVRVSNAKYSTVPKSEIVSKIYDCQNTVICNEHAFLFFDTIKI